jgi:predicted transcriptional regulator
MHSERTSPNKPGHLAALKQRTMTSEELAKELGKSESLIETILRQDLMDLVEMESGAKWKRIPSGRPVG